MPQSPFPDPRPDALPEQTWLGAERLDVYRVALEFLVHATELGRGRIGAALRDQLDRASSSIVLNIAEGGGRVSGPDKARFYTIARGSAMECGAILDVLARQGSINRVDHSRGRQLLVRVVQMLTRLDRRFTARRK